MNERALARRAGSRLLPAALLLMCLLLAFLVPYTHDDWDWGSSGGMERLSTFFEGYNGRYVGNLLIMAVTRSVLLKTVVMGLSLFATLMLLGREARGQGICVTAIGATLFFTMSKPMAEQSIGWLSAFCNYGVGTLAVLLFIRRAFYCLEGPRLSRPVACALFALAGFGGALLMENITITLVLLSLGMTVYTVLRDKRPDGQVMCFFIGSALGASAMFTNSVYGLIAQNRDFYRTLSYQYWGDWETVIGQARWFFHDYHLRCLFDDALPLLFTLLGFAALCMHRLRTAMSARRRTVCMGVLGVLFLYPLYVLLRAGSPEWEPFLKYTGQAEELLGLFYIAALIALPFALPVMRVRRARMVLLLVSVALLSGPLLFVTPIGDRCFYPMFVLEIAYVLELARVCGAARYYRALRVPLLLALAMLCAFFLSIYGRNARASDARVQAARLEAAQGEREIRLAILPYEDYSWDSTPYVINESWFKDFYGLDQSLSITPVPYDTWYREHKDQ